MNILIYTLLTIMGLTLFYTEDLKHCTIRTYESRWLKDHALLYVQLRTSSLSNEFRAIHCRRYRKPEHPGSRKPKDPKKTKKDDKKEPPATTPPPFDSARLPSNAKLNISFWEDPEYPLPFFETFERLLKRVYPSIPHSTLSALIGELHVLAEETLFLDCPDELSTLVFKDPELQKLWYHLLTGSPSLLMFISLDHSAPCSFNLLFAPEEILILLFEQNPAALKQTLSARERLLASVKEGRENKTLWEKTFYTELHPYLPSPLEHYDLSFGTPGNLLTLESPTGDPLYYKVPMVL